MEGRRVQLSELQIAGPIRQYPASVPGEGYDIITSTRLSWKRTVS